MKFYLPYSNKLTTQIFYKTVLYHYNSYGSRSIDNKHLKTLKHERLTLDIWNHNISNYIGHWGIYN